jgi:hypothetical protein
MFHFKLFVKADDEAAAPAPEATANLPPPDPAAEAGLPPDMATDMPPMPPEAAVPEAPEEDPIGAIKARLQGALGTDEEDAALDDESESVTESGGFSG